jgi:hypothetical protein
LGLLLPQGLLLPFSIDIVSQCDVVLLHLLKFFLDESQFVFLTIESENEHIHLVIILNNWNVEAVFIWADLSDVRAFIVVAWGGRGVTRVCQRRRRHLPHLHTWVVGWRRRSGAAAARASHLLAVWGRRGGAARGGSEPPIVVLGLPLHELRMLANHRWPNVEKTTITSNQSYYKISLAKKLILFSM